MIKIKRCECCDKEIVFEYVNCMKSRSLESKYGVIFKTYTHGCICFCNECWQIITKGCFK